MKQTDFPKYSESAPCSECGSGVSSRPTVVEFDRQEIHVFDPVVCAGCLLALCERYAVDCANCGGKIPPWSQVGVLKAEAGTPQLVHMTAACSSVGCAFHGYLGKGTLGEFIQVEAC